METQLRILILEDNPSDAEMEKREIRKYGIRFTDQVVETKEDYIKALLKFNPDIILSDYSLPVFNGMQALLIRKDLAPLVPFILVTGSNREEIAVDCMKAGADDYLLKENLTRLGHAIIAAIEKKETLRSKIKAEDRLRILSRAVEQNPVSIIITDTKGNIEYVNPKFSQITGYSMEEVAGQNPRILKSGKTSPDEYKHLWETITSGREWSGEFENRKKSGEIFFESASISSIADENGNITHFLAVKEDITGRKLSEEALRESETQFRSFFENGADAIFIAEIETGIVVDANQAASELILRTHAEIVGLHQSQIHPQNETNSGVKSFIQDVENTSQNAFPYSNEMEVLRSDGRLVSVDVKASRVMFNGRQCLMGTFRDISERKRAEEALRESNELNRSLLQAIPLGIDIVDEQGHILYQNEILQKYSGGDTIGQKCWSTYHDYQTQCIECPLLSDIEIGKTDVREMIGILGGKIFQVSHTGMLFQGKKTVMKIFEDITVRKHTEQLQKVIYRISNAVNLTENLDELIGIIQKELGLLIDTTNFFVAIYDEKTDTLSLPYLSDINDSYTSFPAGKTLTAYVIRTKKPLLMTKEGLNELAFQGEVEIVGTPSEVWLGVPMIIKDKVTGALVVQSYDNEKAYNLNDLEILEFVSSTIGISIDRKKKEDELKAAMFHALESDRLKSAFLANVSHEIRTPMNGILGFLDILLDSGLSGDERDEYIGIVKASGDRLLATINDIIDISKIEAGHSSIYNTETDINQLLQHLLRFFGPEADNKGLQLEISELLPEMQSKVLTDGGKLESILSNLIKNAMKFTRKGSISFGCRMNGHMPEFFISDTGIGIPQQRIDSIFDRFVQADTSFSRAYEGSGLGLSIARAYVEMLGGQISVESETGKGSTFHFTIVCHPVVSKSQPDMLASSVHGSFSPETLILVAEDDTISFTYLNKLLTYEKIQVMHAFNGEEAVTICRERPEIALVLMDIKMPVLDGYEATRQIKAFRPDLPVIALTAYAFAEDHQKALDSGCNDYLSKPLNKEKLIMVLKKYLNPRD